MTNLQLKDSWNELKGKLKQKYGQLTDDGLRFSEEKEQGLLGRFAEETRQIKEDLRAEFES
jgi:uncharacterized protein YjbJ (UPF0337 family)